MGSFFWYSAHRRVHSMQQYIQCTVLYKIKNYGLRSVTVGFRCFEVYGEGRTGGRGGGALRHFTVRV